MSGGPITFYFDFLSPYAYLAWTELPSLAGRHGREVEPVPILLAALLNTHGQKGPAEIPPKRIYTFKNVLRLAHERGRPLAPPPSHPFNPLLALRVASLPMEATRRRAVIDGLFTATWGGGAGVTEPAEVARIASEAGLDGAAALVEAATPAAKERVKLATEQAIAQGVFGVPTMIADGELFWGVDSLPHLERFLRGEDPVTREVLARFAHVAPSAVRKR